MQVPPWRSSLRRSNLVSTAATIASFLIRGKFVTIIILHPLGIFIGVNGGGGWDQGPRSRRWRSFGVGHILLVHLFFFIGVAEDDDVAVPGPPEDVAVEVAKKFPGELLIT
jgi:hypothetical protein